MRNDFCYASGYRSFAAADDAVVDMYGNGEIFPSDAPRVRSYKAKNGKRYWGVYLLDR